MVPLTVTHLVEYVKDKFKKDLFLREISVKGQISNFKYDPRKNYAFFSLKDSGASIDCWEMLPIRTTGKSLRELASPSPFSDRKASCRERV